MKLKTVEPAEAIYSLETEAKKNSWFNFTVFEEVFLAKFLKKFF
jgi:hypothetical protein